MNGMRNMKTRRARRQRFTRILMCLFALVMFAGLFSQITMLAKVSGQQKQIAKVEKQIRELTANADNLSLCLNQYKNLDRVAALAQQLGMERPNETQIRVVSLPGTIESTSTQSVENISAEEMFN